MKYSKLVVEKFKQSVELEENIFQDAALLNTIIDSSELVINTFNSREKVLLCGNGGSAAEPQRLAAEFTGRYYLGREQLFAETLHVNIAYLTAVANDYSYEEVFARKVKAKGNNDDVLIGLSTSANSFNIVSSFKVAKEIGMCTIGFAGENSCGMKQYAYFLINIPSIDTPRIQELHMLLGH